MSHLRGAVRSRRPGTAVESREPGDYTSCSLTPAVLRARLAGSPTVETLAAIGAVFVCQRLAAAVGVGITGLLALAPPVTARPWTLVTAVYAHATLGHLLGNALVVGLLGLAVERITTRARFHAFVLATGALSGLAEVYANLYLGSPVAVLGISGAAFALLGYVVTGNPVSGRLLDWLDLDADTQLLLMLLVAAGVAVVQTPPGAALVGHFTGLLLGLLAGRVRLLSA